MISEWDKTTHVGWNVIFPQRSEKVKSRKKYDYLLHNLFETFQTKSNRKQFLY